MTTSSPQQVASNRRQRCKQCRRLVRARNAARLCPQCNPNAERLIQVTEVAKSHGPDVAAIALAASLFSRKAGR